MIGLYFVSGMYKGFVWSASTLGVSIVACLLAFLLMGTVSNSIIKNEKLYNSMLSYTEGSEAIYDVELVKSDIKSLSNSEIDEVMSRSNLAYPLKERVYENIMTEAFKAEGITTLGDYFNESIVRVIINIVAFIVVYEKETFYSSINFRQGIFKNFLDLAISRVIKNLRIFSF